MYTHVLYDSESIRIRNTYRVSFACVAQGYAAFVSRHIHLPMHLNTVM